MNKDSSLNSLDFSKASKVEILVALRDMLVSLENHAKELQPRITSIINTIDSVVRIPAGETAEEEQIE